MQDDFSARSSLKGRADDGCCSPKNPCGKLLWTPFNILVGLGTLFALATVCMEVPEVIGARVMTISGWFWWWIAGASFYTAVVVIFIVCHATKQPIQGQEHPQPHMYWMAHLVSVHGAVFNIVIMFIVVFLSNRTVDDAYSDLNHINADTAQITTQPIGVRWAMQALLGIVWSLSHLFVVFFGYLPGEKHPIVNAMGGGSQ